MRAIVSGTEHTRRYAHLASWLVGRPALLVTATPIVNRLSDLGHQLLLAVRDDALVMDGVVSLRLALPAACGAPALGQLVIENQDGGEARPRRATEISNPPKRRMPTRWRGSVELLERAAPFQQRIDRRPDPRSSCCVQPGRVPRRSLGALQRYRTAPAARA